jgi:DNA-binding transcriptional regulator YdaS (Cro superfamily)
LVRYAFNTRMEEICEKVIKDAGGPAKLARALGDLTSQAVSQWKRVPIERVAAVEALTGVSRHELRPDIFGPAPTQGEAA